MTQPGWFADPGGSGQERYWDGSRWTEHVRPPALQRAGAPALPPAGGGYIAYDPRRSVVRAGGTSGRYGFGAALLGLQSGPPLLYGIIALVATPFLDDLQSDADFGGDLDGAQAAFAGIGVVLLAIGAAFFAAAVGVAMSRQWGRVLGLVLESLSILGLLGFAALVGAADGPIIGFLVPLVVPIAVVALLAKNETASS